LTAAITSAVEAQPKVAFRAFDTIDNAPEERERGITIAVSHVEYETRTGTTHTWIARATPIHQEYDHRRGADGCAILVVAATDGPMPQTREHILLARRSVCLPSWCS